MVYLILVAVICSGGIGYMSYMTMRESLIHIAEDSAPSLLKQVSVRVEESIQDFQDSTYSFVSRPEIQNLLTRKKEPEKSPWKYSRDQLDLSGSFLSMTALYKYADIVILETGEKEIYYYDQAPADQKITAGQVRDIMAELRSQVTSAVPIKWVKKDGRVYFVRQVADTKQKPGSRSVGTAVFVIADAFFDLREDKNIYVSNQNTMICGKEGEIYKNNHLQMTEQALKPYLSYKDGRYYIYSAMRKINNEEYLTVTVRTHRLGWNILCMIPYSVILKEADQVIPRIAAAALLLLGAGLLVGCFLYHFLQKNLKIIEQGMLQYEIFLDPKAFMRYHADSRQWQPESGAYEITIGSSMQDIRLRETAELQEILLDIGKEHNIGDLIRIEGMYEKLEKAFKNHPVSLRFLEMTKEADPLKAISMGSLMTLETLKRTDPTMTEQEIAHLLQMLE
ncbi:hypothetical protein D3Z62_07145 [Lachnospiraceae bacterium]|nr:hypothetical protein [Lachnospiraceae bacterium]